MHIEVVSITVVPYYTVITRDVPVERDCNTITVLLLLLFQINNQSINQSLLWNSYELAEGTNTLFTALKARYGKQSDYWVELNHLSFSDPLLAQDLVKLDTNQCSQQVHDVDRYVHLACVLFLIHIHL